MPSAASPRVERRGVFVASRLPAAPPVLAGFTYVRPLGAGGFADVFLYQQDMPRRAVAVKVLLQDLVDDDLLRLFASEADAMARLSAHPSILTIYQASVSADGRPYIVMEYCPRSFASRYRRETIPVAEVLHTGVKIASALESAHREGLLHRDIKPSNILLTTYGAPVLSDFGIATSMVSHSDEVIAMSVPWSAPEIIDESTAGSVSTEVWSLGATLYSLLAGRSPFERADHATNGRAELKARIRRARYTPIDRSDVSDDVQAVLQRALSRDSGERFATMAEFAHALQLVQYAGGIPVTPLELAEGDILLPIDPASPAPLPPRGSQVPHVSPRRPRPGSRQAAPDDDLPGEQHRRRISPLVWVAIAATAALLASAAAIIGVLR